MSVPEASCLIDLDEYLRERRSTVVVGPVVGGVALHAELLLGREEGLHLVHLAFFIAREIL